MRTKKSILNMLMAISLNIVNVFIGLIARKVFLLYLNTEYLGLNALFTNIVSTLSIIEMGIGTSIIYHLYQPIYEKDKERINSLLNFYKWAYRFIAVIVFLIGMLIVPFLSRIVGTIDIEVNYYIIYFMFLADVICSYLLSYKRSILNANQENYLIQLIHVLYIVFLNFTQILILMLTKNFYLYQASRVIFRLLENVVISVLANKKYPFIKESSKKLDKCTIHDIFTKVKGLLWHRIGLTALQSSDSIIISSILGLIDVAFYSNYKLIINALLSLINGMFGSLNASIGSFLIEHKGKRKSFYRNLVFSNFWIATFTTTCFICCINDFIKIWIGEEYVLSFVFILLFSFYYFLRAMDFSSGTFKEAAGIFYEDRFIPMIQLFVNIFFSVILGIFFGLNGVLVGTVISEMIPHIFEYSKYVYRDLIQGSYKEYFYMYFDFFISLFCIIFITYTICEMTQLKNIYLELIKNMILSFLLSNCCLLLRYKNDSRFHFYLNKLMLFKEKRV